MNTTTMRRIQFLGCPLDCLTSGELLEELKHAILAKAPPRVIQFVNANKVAMVRSEPWMGEILVRSDYVLADGRPMLPMAAMLGLTIPERIDGIGLMHKLMKLADREGFSIYLLGAKQEIVEECVRRIGRDFPGARIAGFRNGYGGGGKARAPVGAALRDRVALPGDSGTAPDVLALHADEWQLSLGFLQSLRQPVVPAGRTGPDRPGSSPPFAGIQSGRQHGTIQSSRERGKSTADGRG